jgi:DNA-binding transcriptional regulator/RsmH inhibitor MraZ
MPPGRRPGRALDPEDSSSIVDVGLAAIDDRGRLTLPSHVVQQLAWAQSAEAQEILLAHVDHGILQVLPWSPFGEQVIQRKKELEESSSRGDAPVEALVALNLRYRRAVLEVGRRTTLLPDVRLHLGIEQDRKGSVHVIRIGDRLEILSRTAYDALLFFSHPKIDDLP